MAFVHTRTRIVLARCFCLVALLAAASACASAPKGPPVGAEEPDKFLYEHGSEALKDKRWFAAREYFRQLVDSYPQSDFRADAKLGIGDSYLGEGTAEGQVLAINEYQQFIAYFPTHDRAHYAQYQLGMAHFEQMRGPTRDQTETRAAIAEFTTYVQRYPDRPLIAEAKARLRETKDRLSDSEYNVGYFYLRSRMSIPGAVDRFNGILKSNPEYTRRDAVYYQMAQALVLAGQPAAAIPYLDKLVNEFEVSEYLEPARTQLADLNAQMQAQIKK
ncbi:MAG: outer membrane protein assembly factor BamD [Acidobacteriota bacterium]|nr:outer membrane protein assembly factor BamD [Acidobacteriota bacterium]